MTPHSPAAKRARPAASIEAPYWLTDANLLRPAALVFMLSLAAAVTMVGASHWLLASSTEQQRHVQQVAQAALKRTSQITDQGRQISAYQQAFLALKKRGLIGEEQRLNWIEAIKQSQAARQLAPITYTIDAQQPLHLEGGFDSAGYQLRGSRMSLHMEPLHEMDVFNLLDDLKRSGGFFAVQDCSIKRGGMAAVATQAHGLIADCTLNWLSLAAAGQAPASTPAPSAGPGDKP